MEIFKHYTTQHQDSVAFVFKKYGVKAAPTARNLQLAILAGKDTNFLQDLMNAIYKRSLGHSNYEDDFDYYLVDMDANAYDAETIGIVDTFEFDYADKSAKKAKRKQKKILRKEKKQAKKDSKADKRSNRGGSMDISNAEISGGDDGGSGGGLSVGEKIEKAFGVVGNLATAAGGIAGQFINKNGDSSNSQGDEGGGDYTQNAPEKSGVKKYLPYIIGGVALIVVIGILIVVLKKKK